MNRVLLLAATASVAIVVITQAAQADQMVAFQFNGMGVSGSGTLTYVPNVSPPDPNPLCGTAGQNPCRSDPVGAYRISDVAGTFSDTNIGILGASISGLVPTDPANERDPTFNGLVPSSLSFIDAGLSYNNLFFPNGSPIDCDFPFLGTFLDVFGMAFTISGGDTVNVWGDGNSGPDGSLTYGVGVTNGAATLDYQFDGVSAEVPEPATLFLFTAGLIGVAATRRRRNLPKLVS